MITFVGILRKYFHCRIVIRFLAQSSTAFVLTHNFQGTHILGASRGRLSDSVASCKNRLDRHWNNENVKFDWTAELTGTGAVV